MFLESLSLENYRNYERLRSHFGPGVVVLQGENAQGKTNLLEAIYLLATTKSVRARGDADLIRWGSYNPLAPAPFSRLVAHVRRAHDSVEMEVLIRDTPASASVARRNEDGDTADGEAFLSTSTSGQGGARKRFKVNGVVRKASETLGQINAVFFAPADVELVAGSPSERRRFLDVMLCQLQQPYVRALQTYNRVVMQRNHLLRQVRDNRQPPQALDYWNEMLVTHGSFIMSCRMEALASLGTQSAFIHARLSDSREHLRVIYRPSLGQDDATTTARGGGRGDYGAAGRRAGLDQQGGLAESLHVAGKDEPAVAAPDLRAGLQQGLVRLRDKEISQGVSLIGPHRDDLALLVNGVDMTAFGSRGQQRSVALALKMAELSYMRAERGEWPILLLDDATSELDERRRSAILELAGQEEQVFMTTADPAHVVNGLAQPPQHWSVAQGHLHRLSTPAPADAVAENRPIWITKTNDRTSAEIPVEQTTIVE